MNILKERRVRLDLTQSRVASLAGIPQAYYSQLENGERTPSVRTAKKLGEVLHFDWWMLFEGVK